MFTAPTAFRAIRKEDPEGKFIRQYDLSKFRTLFLAGERADPPTVEWAEQQLKVPVIDHWWQTRNRLVHSRQSGGARHAAGEARLADSAMPGYQVDVVDESCKAGAGQHHGLDRHQAADAAGVPADAVAAGGALQGSVPVGISRLLQTSDAGYKDEDGYVWVMGRHR